MSEKMNEKVNAKDLKPSERSSVIPRARGATTFLPGINRSSILTIAEISNSDFEAFSIKNLCVQFLRNTQEYDRTISLSVYRYSFERGRFCKIL